MTVEGPVAVGAPDRPPPRRGSWLPILLYPAGFPLSVIILVWAESEISLVEIVRPIVAAVVASLAMTVLLGRLARDRRLGAMAASAIWIALIVDRPEARLILVAAAIGVVLIGGLRRQGSIVRAGAVATRLLALIATIVFAAALLFAVGRPSFLSVVAEPFLPLPGPADRPPPSPRAPDIFVYLLDGYPGATAVRRLSGLDADAFPTALESRGFTVHDDSRTNYLITRIVLASMFEGRHIRDIPELAAPFGPDPAADARRLRSVMAHGAMLAGIRAAGYDLVWVSSGWTHLDIRNVDHRFEAPGPNEFEMVLLRQTALADILQAVDPNGFGDVMRTRIEAVFQAATTIAAEPHSRPRFVLVHVPAPHPPSVLTADGGPEDGDPDSRWDQVGRTGQTSDEDIARTTGQVQAIGQMTIESVDALRSTAPTPPVIVVFSDHGTDVGWDEESPMSSDLAERTSTVLATLTPGHPDLFRQPTTPVNLFATLANAYAGTNVPPQPDVSYGFDGSVLNVIPVETTTGN